MSTPRVHPSIGWEVLVLAPGAVPDGQSRLAVHHDPDSRGQSCHFDADQILWLRGTRVSVAMADAAIEQRLQEWWAAVGLTAPFPPIAAARERLRQGLGGR